MIDAACEALQQEGGVVLYPTETVYGIGGRACDVQAAHRIGELKGRGLQPLIVLVNEAPEGMPPLAAALAEAFWPGALTLVVPSMDRFPSAIQGPEGSIALRCSPHPVVRSLIDAVGPVTSTSANRTGEPPVLRAQDAPFSVDAVVDDGPLLPAAPSTLVHFSGRILRRGGLADEIDSFLEAWFAGDSSTA